jgi:TolB-like protein
MNEARFGFGPFILDANAGTLQRQGIPVAIGYRGLLLLQALIAAGGEIVSKSKLMDAAWPGTAVEEGNLSVQIGTLRKLLGPRQDGGEWIVNVPRIGYRFSFADPAQEASTAARPVELGPSIAVLPFVSLSDDSEQAYFADGLTEDLIIRLSRMPWLFVAARNSSFSYKGNVVDPRQIGKDLNVRYILEGSVRRSGNRLRIATQLGETSTARQVWASSHDVELADFFALQDRISEAVIGAIERRLYAAEHERFKSRPPESLDAWGFVMKAMPFVWTWGAADEIATAQALLRQAIAIDPTYARANSLLSWTLAARVQLGISQAVDEMAPAIDMAEDAIHRAPEDPWSHFAAGYAHMVARHVDQALAALNEAIAINPSFALAHIILGSTYGYAGLPEDGLHHLALAEQMSPRDFSQAAIYSTMATCHFVAGRYAEAVALGRRAVQLRPHFGTAWRTLSASSGMAGEIDSGREALARAKGLHPSLSLDWVERNHPIVRKADLDRYLAGLNAVGLT